MKLSDFQVTSTFGVLAVALTALTALAFAVTLAFAQLKHVALDASYLPWVDKWLDFMTWLIAFVVAGVVGKRATAKPEVIDAETRQAALVGSVPPPGPEDKP